jgi:GNAT superfamily N-acetyltransferase
MSALPARLVRLRNKVRERGLARVMGESASNLLYKRINAVYLERDLDAPLPLLRRHAKITLKQMERIENAPFRRFFSSHVGVYRRLLDEGCHCQAALVDDEVIAVAWWADRDFFDRDVYRINFPVADDEIYQFAGFLAEPFRNTTIAVNTLDAIYREARALGRRRAYAVVDLKNTPSLKLHLHVGFRERGTMLVMRRYLEGFVVSRNEPYATPLLGHLERRSHPAERQRKEQAS